MERELIEQGVYRHYKSRNLIDERNGIYKVIGTAFDSETKEEVVIYKQFYDGDFPKGTRWTRTKKAFLENIVVNGTEVPRFEFIGMQMPWNDKKQKRKK